MFTTRAAAADLKKIVSRAKRLALEDLRSGRVEHEPALTDRLATHLQVAIEQSSTILTWHGKTLTDRAANSQERRYGADLLGALHIETPEYKVSKGFLAQAKLMRPGKSFAAADEEDLHEQCEKMFKLSKASYVFVYTPKDIRVVPANAVLASPPRNPLDYDAITLEGFFQAHANCFLGDLDIMAASPQQLEILRDKYQARNGFRLSATLPANLK